eukprot:845927-Prymnesium_polylepis.2
MRPTRTFGHCTGLRTSASHVSVWPMAEIFVGVWALRPRSSLASGLCPFGLLAVLVISWSEIRSPSARTGSAGAAPRGSRGDVCRGQISE